MVHIALALALGVTGCSREQSSDSSAGTPRGQEVPQSAAPPMPNRYITGIVFEDRNGNGNYDTGDVRMPQQTIVLTDAEGRHVQTAATGSDGAFRFERLERGEYRVTMQAPEGFVHGNDNPLTLSVPEDGSPAEVQFGLRRTPAPL